MTSRLFRDLLDLLAELSVFLSKDFVAVFVASLKVFKFFEDAVVEGLLLVLRLLFEVGVGDLLLQGYDFLLELKDCGFKRGFSPLVLGELLVTLSLEFHLEGRH